MKHESWVERAANHAGLTLDAHQLGQLASYGEWLGSEGRNSGGLGPLEVERLSGRHLADALLFAGPFRSERPDSLLDVGSGLGLPGIPLAVAWPGCQVTLLDRSAGRARLARRAVRILELGNVEVRVGSMEGEPPASQTALTARGVEPIGSLAGKVARLLVPGGLAVLGGSHRKRPVVPPGVMIEEVPTTVLDHRVWLLIIRGS